MLEVVRSLGDGAIGPVYEGRLDGTKCAFIAFQNINHYLIEYRAYWNSHRTGSLRGRVPSYDCCHPLPASLVNLYRCPEVICVELVTGPTLSDNSLTFLPSGPLGELENYLQATLEIFHNQAGFCHGNVEVENIMLLPRDNTVDNGAFMRALFFNFGQAVFRDGVDADTWESSKKDDHAKLRRIFQRPKALLASREAMTFVTSMPLNDTDQQVKLAELVSAAVPCDILLNALRSIKDPVPQLALSIVEAIGRGQGPRSQLEFLESYDPPNLEDLSQDQNRPLLKLESIQASCSSLLRRPNFDQLYAQLIAKCRLILGATDRLTLAVRLDYSQQLQADHGRTADAATIFLGMVRDLLNLHQIISQDPNKRNRTAWAETWLDFLVHGMKTIIVPGYPILEDESEILFELVNSCLVSARAQQTAVDPPLVPGQRWRRDVLGIQDDTTPSSAEQSAIEASADQEEQGKFEGPKINDYMISVFAERNIRRPLLPRVARPDPTLLPAFEPSRAQGRKRNSDALDMDGDTTSPYAQMDTIEPSDAVNDENKFGGFDIHEDKRPKTEVESNGGEGWPGLDLGEWPSPEEP